MTNLVPNLTTLESTQEVLEIDDTVDCNNEAINTDNLEDDKN